ncbi:ADP-ribosylglycohydrolase family protein [Nocardioides salsibiostraticola]
MEHQSDERIRLSAAQLDRACGVLLGAAAGDALGAGYEFAYVDEDLVPAMIGGGLGNFAPGEWTDDTSMTWGIAQVAATGVDLHTPAALDAIARNFRDWYETRPPDIGINTSAVLSAAGPNPSGTAMTTAAKSREERTGRTGGNGSLMRTAPVALAYLNNPKGLVEAAMAVSALTHYDTDAQEACALWCLGIRHAVWDGDFDLRRGLRHLPERSQAKWQERLDEAEGSPPSSFNPNGGAVAALMAAWSSICQTAVPSSDDRYACEHLVDALGTAIRIGHDTDTVASIAGALLGARWGMSAIPAGWRRVLHGYPGLDGRELERLACLIVRQGRPGKYGWPTVDHIEYTGLQYGKPALARHPHDPGVWLAGATALDAIPGDVTAVVSLCLTGLTQVPTQMQHINFRLMDEPDPAANPNLDYVLADAARTLAGLRAEGEIVLLHCVAAHSRTPTVGIAYAVLLGIPLDRAIREVCAVLPTARPNAGFRRALEHFAPPSASTLGPATSTRSNGSTAAPCRSSGWRTS